MSALPPSQRANVLRAYRELLSLARRLPAAQRDAALAEARAGVRANAAEADPGAASEHLKRLWGRIGFLRMTLPRLPGDRARGSGTFVMRDGELVQGTGQSAGTRVATGILDMNEARVRHNALIKRQHFGRMPASTEPF